MSRCILPVNETGKFCGIVELVVGLDGPMGHWFYQCYGPEDEDGEPTFIEGDGLSGCSRNDLLRIIQKYADSDDSGVTRVATQIALDLDPKDARIPKGSFVHCF